MKAKAQRLSMTEIRIGAPCYYKQLEPELTYQTWSPAKIKSVERTTKGVPVLVKIYDEADEKTLWVSPNNFFPIDTPELESWIHAEFDRCSK